MSKKNFKIIENSQPKYLEKYEEFLKLYFNPKIRKPELLKKLDWSDIQYRHALKKAQDEGKIKLNTKNPKYYYYDKHSRKYTVIKRTKEIQVQTYCKTEKEAKELVKYLQKNGWTEKNVKNFKRMRI